jgi:hypothetical protein
MNNIVQFVLLFVFSYVAACCILIATLGGTTHYELFCYVLHGILGFIFYGVGGWIVYLEMKK